MTSLLGPDNYYDIGKLIDDGTTWKAFISSSRTIYNVTSHFHEEKKSQFINPLWTLIESHPDNDWNWICISKNPNTAMAIIESHPEKPWKWILISTNKFRK